MADTNKTTKGRNTMITKKGISLGHELASKGLEWQWGDRDNVLDTLSLIARHSKTYRNIVEIQCGNGVVSGEWVNDNIEWLEKREEQLLARLAKLGEELAIWCSKGSPKVHLAQTDPRGYLVSVTFTPEDSHERSVGIE